MQTVHVTVWKGEPIQLVRCMQCCNKYHCPFCRPEVFKPTAGSKLLKHIRAHEKRAVKFKDYVIFKCNLTCRSYSHFHCPTCIKVVDKRGRFLSHLEKCVTETPYNPLCKADGHYLHIKEEPESYDGSDEERDHPAPEEDVICRPVRNHKAPLTNLQHSASLSTTGDLRIKSEDRVQKVSCEKENTPVQHSDCSNVENDSGRGAVISLQISQGSSLFNTDEVSVNMQCLLELFQLCWRCHRVCTISIEGHEKLFIVTQDCPSCKYLRQWRSHPTSPEPGEPAESLHNEHTEAEAASYPVVEHHVKEESGEEAGIRLLSSDTEHSLTSFEQMFIEIDGSYLSNAEENRQYIEHWNSGIRIDAIKQENENTSLKEETVENIGDGNTPQKQENYEDWRQDLEEGEATNFNATLDEDLFTALKEDSHLKVVVWCTDCGTDALLSCSLHRHKKLFCCAHCGEGENTEIQNLAKLPVRFEDFGSFQRHAEKEHGAKAFHKLCQGCGKFVISDPETGAVKDHKCERNVCPACGKKFLTETGLKTHYTEHHEDSDHPCKYCLKVFNTRPLKLEHEQTHPQEKQPYSCPDCPEKFDNVHKRNSHLKSHRGSYKYFCDICEKYFKDIIRLRRHKLLHTREKPYKCQVCERSFNQMENLKSHKCEGPGESFTLSVSLKNNQVQQRHSGDDQMDTEETVSPRESGPE